MSFLHSGIEECLDRFEEFGFMEEEAVMPVICFDFDEADICGNGIECFCKISAFASRKEPIACE